MENCIHLKDLPQYPSYLRAQWRIISNNLILKSTVQIYVQEDNGNSTTEKDRTGSRVQQEHQSFLPNAIDRMSEVYDLDFIIEVYENFLKIF